MSSVEFTRQLKASSKSGSRPIAATVPADLLGLDHQLCFALYSASLAMTKLYKPLLAPLRLTYPQYLVLLALWERDGSTVGELGERLSLDSGTLTPLLKRLQAVGFVERARDAGDERRVVVSLTSAGAGLQQQARSIPWRLAEATRCSAAELTELTQRLQQLRSELQSAHAAPASAAPPPP